MAKSYKRFSRKRGQKRIDPPKQTKPVEGDDDLWKRIQEAQNMPMIEDFFEGPKNY